MSISANFPNVFPSLELNFAQSQQLDPRVTFSRSTTAPYYDGKTSVLAEQNLVLQSQTFGTSWIIQNATQTANSITAPDGTSTGTTLTSTSSVSTSVGAYQSVSTIIGSTLAIYAKVGTSNFIGVTSSSGGQSYANFNLNTGVVSSSSNCTASIINAGNGWYRCVIANTTTAGTNQFFIAPKDADPSGNPWQFGTCASGNYVYIWGAQLEQRSSVTAYNATTTTPITNYIPQLLTAPINAPRFDFNPTTGESLGLLIEEQRTNLSTYSSGFSNAGWTKNNASITANINIAPDGTQTVSKLVENTTASVSHYASCPAITPSASTAYTGSIYVKAGERNYALFELNGGGGDAYSFINLTTGVITTGGGTGTFTSTNVGNGWWRVTCTYTTSSTANLSVFVYPATSSSTYVYTGDGYSGIYIWGAQLEAGAFATSYIPTTSAQVTRAADVENMTGTNFSSWYNIVQGSFYAEAKAIYNLSTTGGARYLLANTNTNSYYLYANQNSANITNYDGTNITQAAVTDFSVFNKFMSTYGSSNKTINNNGLTVVSGSYTQQWANNTGLGIGQSGPSGSLPWNGWIKKVSFYPIQFTSSQQIALTGS